MLAERAGAPFEGTRKIRRPDLPPRRDLVAPPDHFNDRKDIVISFVSGPRGVSRR